MRIGNQWLRTLGILRPRCGRESGPDMGRSRDGDEEERIDPTRDHKRLSINSREATGNLAVVHLRLGVNMCVVHSGWGVVMSCAWSRDVEVTPDLERHSAERRSVSPI